MGYESWACSVEIEYSTLAYRVLFSYTTPRTLHSSPDARISQVPLYPASLATSPFRPVHYSTTVLAFRPGNTISSPTFVQAYSSARLAQPKRDLTHNILLISELLENRSDYRNATITEHSSADQCVYRVSR